ncbi:MAG TPA: hypothetical protein VGP24_11670 [Glaciihabitans sp.]|jgi:hypothetical protein|nr:hypothetical protein [Glaciihabitans sp.]
MSSTLDQKWFDEFILELRLRDVSGEGIGDHLATVKEFVADSGESAEAAFGAPRDYVASLDLSAYTQPVSVAGVVAQSVIGLAAFLIFAQAIWPWSAGESLDVGVAQLAWLSLPLIGITLLPLYLGALLRRFWLLVVLTLVFALAGVLSAVSAPQTAEAVWFSLDPLLVMVASALIMIAASIISTVRVNKDADESIREPFSEPGDGAKEQSQPRLVGYIGAWLFPLCSLFFLAIVLISR